MNLVNQTGRRGFLRQGGILGMALAAAAFLPRMAFAAWNKPAFDSKSVADVYKALGVASASPSTEVEVMASDIAENGAVVPVSVISKLPNTTQISLLVEQNPTTLTAQFDLDPGVLPDISTRVKLAKTTKVVALVKADGKYYTASKEIKVTLGGCGG